MGSLCVRVFDVVEERQLGMVVRREREEEEEEKRG